MGQEYRGTQTTPTTTKESYCFSCKSVNENGMVIEIVINSNDFLLHMARMIAGVLLEVGKNKMEAMEVQKILNEKKRTEAVPMAQPKGLCLRDVKYS